MVRIRPAFQPESILHRTQSTPKVNVISLIFLTTNRAKAKKAKKIRPTYFNDQRQLDDFMDLYMRIRIISHDRQCPQRIAIFHSTLWMHQLHQLQISELLLFRELWLPCGDGEKITHVRERLWTGRGGLRANWVHIITTKCIRVVRNRRVPL